MLQNNLDPEVAENPDALVVYGGIGKAARNWDCSDAIAGGPAQDLRRRRDPAGAESGKPVGVFRTHADAPRVLIANSNLVPHWATWEHFHELDSKGLMMYGQMTAGSLDLHRHAGHRAGHLRDLRRGRPAALRRRPGRALDPDRRPRRHGRRAAAGRHDCRRLPRSTSSASRAASTSRSRPATSTSRPTTSTTRWRVIDATRPARRPVSVGAAGQRRRRCCPSWSRAAAVRPPDIVTDQTSAHDPINGYLPGGLDRGAVAGARADADPQHAALSRPPRESMRRCMSQAMLDFQRHGHAHGATTATTSARWPWTQGVAERLRLPRLRARLHPPAVLPRAWARSAGWRSRGDPDDIDKTDAKMQGAVPRQRAPAPLARHGAASASRFQGLPARICWLGLGERAPRRPGLQRHGRKRRAQGAHRDRPRPPRQRLGRLAQPRDRGHEGRLATRSSDWPLLNALLNTASGATWVSLHHGGGVGMGYSQHSGVVIVCDGTPRPLTDASRACCANDPATGVMRHADAGLRHRHGQRHASSGLNLPMIGSQERTTADPDATTQHASRRRQLDPGRSCADLASAAATRMRAGLPALPTPGHAAPAPRVVQQRGRGDAAGRTASTPASASWPTSASAKADLATLQLNLMRSHSGRRRASRCGAEVVRLMLVLEGRQPGARPLRRARRGGATRCWRCTTPGLVPVMCPARARSALRAIWRRWRT